MMMQAKFKPRKQQNYKKISFYLLFTAYNTISRQNKVLSQAVDMVVVQQYQYQL